MFVSKGRNHRYLCFKGQGPSLCMSQGAKTVMYVPKGRNQRYSCSKGQRPSLCMHIPGNKDSRDVFMLQDCCSVRISQVTKRITVHVRKDKDHDKRMSVVTVVFLGKDSGCVARQECWLCPAGEEQGLSVPLARTVDRYAWSEGQCPTVSVHGSGTDPNRGKRPVTEFRQTAWWP